MSPWSPRELPWQVRHWPGQGPAALHASQHGHRGEHGDGLVAGGWTGECNRGEGRGRMRGRWTHPSGFYADDQGESWSSDHGTGEQERSWKSRDCPREGGICSTFICI